TISQPGSYFITHNLTLPAGNSGVNGITIASDNVTIDLGGFMLDGAGIGASGITTNAGHHAIQVRNGNAQNWTQSGFDLSSCFSVVMENLEARNNSIGIQVANGEVSHCVSNSNSSTGLVATRSNVTDCGAAGNPVGFSLDDSTLRGSRASSSSDRGIDAGAS